MTVEVVIVTCDQPAALAVTLASLMAQTHPPTRVMVVDEGAAAAWDDGRVRAVVRVLRARGVEAELQRPGARGQGPLLDRAPSRYRLLLPQDVLLEPDVLARLVAAVHDDEPVRVRRVGPVRVRRVGPVLADVDGLAGGVHRQRLPAAMYQ